MQSEKERGSTGNNMQLIEKKIVYFMDKCVWKLVQKKGCYCDFKKCTKVAFIEARFSLAFSLMFSVYGHFVKCSIVSTSSHPNGHMLFGKYFLLFFRPLIISGIFYSAIIPMLSRHQFIMSTFKCKAY